MSEASNAGQSITQIHSKNSLEYVIIQMKNSSTKIKRHKKTAIVEKTASKNGFKVFRLVGRVVVVTLCAIN